MSGSIYGYRTGEYDWVFQTEHKIELLGLLRKAYRAVRRESLKVNLCNEIEYTIKSGAKKKLSFEHSSFSEESKAHRKPSQLVLITTLPSRPIRPHNTPTKSPPPSS